MKFLALFLLACACDDAAPPAMIYDHAVALADAGHCAEALPLFEELGDERWQGYCLLELGRAEEALACLAGTRGAEPYLADCYQALGMHEEEVALRSWILSEGEDPDGLFNLAAAWRDERDWLRRRHYYSPVHLCIYREEPDVESLFLEVLSHTPPWDESYPIVLGVLAEECEARGDGDQADRLLLEADDRAVGSTHR